MDEAQIHVGISMIFGHGTQLQKPEMHFERLPNASEFFFRTQSHDKIHHQLKRFEKILSLTLYVSKNVPDPAPTCGFWSSTLYFLTNNALGLCSLLPRRWRLGYTFRQKRKAQTCYTLSKEPEEC